MSDQRIPRDDESVAVAQDIEADEEPPPGQPDYLTATKPMRIWLGAHEIED
jgi:hypothetical protein